MAIVFKEGDPMDLEIAADVGSVSEIVNALQRNKHMLFNEKLSDVTFIVGATEETQKKIFAHTLLLTQASDVFATMFSESWKKDEPIQVIDFEAPTFCSLLRWIYCDELIFPGMLADVVKIAHKYMVHSLTSFVTSNFSKVDKKYVWSFHSMAIELEMKDFVEKCLSIIKSNPATHMASADFLNASCASVTVFVSLDKTSITELQLFTRCLEWSEKECKRQGLEVQPENQRKVMEPFIYRISFESMRAAEFAGLPCESGVLTGDEQAVILRIAAGKSVESRFMKKQEPEGNGCRNWKPAPEYHFYCNLCDRHVCLDCYVAEIRNTGVSFCSRSWPRGSCYGNFILDNAKRSHDYCKGPLS